MEEIGVRTEVDPQLSTVVKGRRSTMRTHEGARGRERTAWHAGMSIRRARGRMFSNPRQTGRAHTRTLSIVLLGGPKLVRTEETSCNTFPDQVSVFFYNSSECPLFEYE